MLVHACDLELPENVSRGDSFSLVPIAQQLPDRDDELSLSGEIIIEDACTVIIKDLVYTPEIPNVFLYKSDLGDLDDEGAMGVRVSKESIQHSAFEGTEQEITLQSSIASSHSLKLFAESDSFVLAGATINESSSTVSSCMSLWIALAFKFI